MHCQLFVHFWWECAVILPKSLSATFELSVTKSRADHCDQTISPTEQWLLGNGLNSRNSEGEATTEEKLYSSMLP